MNDNKKKIAIIGGGPSALYTFKHIVDSGASNIVVDIFEAKEKLGHGFPYSTEGALPEHVTNISANETPPLETSLKEWAKSLPDETLLKYGLSPSHFNENKVVPRLFFGDYLEAEFDLLLTKARNLKIETNIHLNSMVTDIIDHPEKNSISVQIGSEKFDDFDHVILCSGHNWPTPHEAEFSGYFDSPYPPSKLAHRTNHPVAIRGSSLTAIDAVRTLSRQNGEFYTNEQGIIAYRLDKESPDFRLILHSKEGLLPCIRIYLEEPLVTTSDTLTEEEINAHIAQNDGFLSLDFIFDGDFKKPLKDKDPLFYETIKNMRMEEFVEAMMNMRENADPFVLLAMEYNEAKKSIRNKQAVHWKEMLATLSFAMNYPAKHFCAEDMLRLKTHLLPLIAVVIAFIPQNSCEEIMALQAAGILDLISVDDKSRVEPLEDGGAIYRLDNDTQTEYKTFVDCIGQPHLSLEDLPFKGLIESGAVSQAYIRFRSENAAKELHDNKDVETHNGKFYLKVSGLAINDDFQSIDKNGEPNPRLYIMAVPYIGGFNSDYSGFDFCEEASKTIIRKILS
ncbi:MAG: hypothetical protein DI586_05040 [Micavibrio aeruginosavorus]|uniref:FAD-dependent urate hydroxylase HpyO/Asp monooxygenase CreE-like FAD/NAD(P)-binding domain-containing protein n=1 Tax=Micavibrio aeruginosavorus TaxID=349221 RepID=A0A2W5FJ28_9BACT|nr:MAG: hypothetical protein DI586_05040 [Micavibrio aeruginosavorus]